MFINKLLLKLFYCGTVDDNILVQILNDKEKNL